jgi:hypothetical protein
MQNTIVIGFEDDEGKINLLKNKKNISKQTSNYLFV